MDLEFTGEIWYWRGPAPYYFVTVPPMPAAQLLELAPAVSYGWGMIPATVVVGATQWPTSLFPKDGGYVVPLKAWVRRDEELDDGDTITVRLTVEA